MVLPIVLSKRRITNSLMDPDNRNLLEAQLSEFFSSSAYSSKRKALLRELTGSTGKIAASLEHLEKSYTSAIPEFRGGMTLDCELFSDPTVKLRILTHKRENKKVKDSRGMDTVEATVKFVRWLNSYDRFLVTVIDRSIAIKPRQVPNKAIKVEPSRLHSNDTEHPVEEHVSPNNQSDPADQIADVTTISTPSTELDNSSTNQHSKTVTTDEPLNQQVLSIEAFNTEVAEESKTDLKNISEATDLIWKLVLNPIAVGTGKTRINVPGIGQISLKKDGALAVIAIDRSDQPDEWKVHSFSEVTQMAPRKRNELEKRALTLSLDLNDTLGIARGDAFSIAAATLRLTNDLLGSDVGIELPDRKSLQRKMVGDTSHFVVHGAKSIFHRVANSIVDIIDKPDNTTEESQ